MSTSFIEQAFFIRDETYISQNEYIKRFLLIIILLISICSVWVTSVLYALFSYKTSYSIFLIPIWLYGCFMIIIYTLSVQVYKRLGPMEPWKEFIWRCSCAVLMLIIVMVFLWPLVLIGALPFLASVFYALVYQNADMDWNFPKKEYSFFKQYFSFQSENTISRGAYIWRFSLISYIVLIVIPIFFADDIILDFHLSIGQYGDKEVLINILQIILLSGLIGIASLKRLQDIHLWCINVRNYIIGIFSTIGIVWIINVFCKHQWIWQQGKNLFSRDITHFPEMPVMWWYIVEYFNNSIVLQVIFMLIHWVLLLFILYLMVIPGKSAHSTQNTQA